MSTHATVGILYQDKKLHKNESIQTIYVHNDGDTLLPILRKHYASIELVEPLIHYGNASVIAPNLEPHPKKPHTFEQTQKNVCLFYGRDRAEKEEEYIQKFTSITKLVNNMGEPYHYLYHEKDQCWYQYDGFGKRKNA